MALALAAAALLVSCGKGGASQPPSSTPAGAPAADADPGARYVPGDPELASGLRILPDPDVDSLPPPRRPAVAGVDFAADRFIAIFEKSPQAPALAPYLTGSPEGQGDDAVRPDDNAPLVRHPYFRQVSVALARKYGLSLHSRVFYKDVNFAVYEVPGVETAADLDAAMRRVFAENVGLVREVCYDYFVKAVGRIGGYDYDRLLENNPAGLKSASESADTDRTASAPPNDPMHLNKRGTDGGTWCNWRVKTIDGLAWGYTTGSADVVVAVIDTGVRYTHEDLAANAIDPQNDPPYNEPGVLTDVINKDNDPNDDHGHGTNCAGCVGAVGNNGKGLAGMNQTVTILPVKVLSSGGSGSDSQVAQGMLIADYLGADVLSLSLGGDFPDRTTQLAAKQCWQDGRVIVIAAGNGNVSAPHYPGYYHEAIAVGATTLVNSSDNQDFSLVDGELPVDSRFDARATFSHYGEWVDIAAPGVEVRTTARFSDSSYTAATAGTSFSCPYVAGCAALLLAYDDSLTNEDVRAALLGGATEMTHLNNGANPKGFLNGTSNGNVRFCNVKNSLDLVDAGLGTAPDVEWDNPADGDTVSGTQEIRIAVSGGTGNVNRVEFETQTRFLGVVTEEDDGFYRLDWDTTFEFNREMELFAKVYTDEGRMNLSSIHVTPSNEHWEPPDSEDFTGVGNNAIPTGWYKFDGNQGTTNTSWGADDTVFFTDAPSMHSSGTTGNYATTSNDWLFAPIVDLRGHAASTVTFQRRYQTSNGYAAYFILTDDDATYWGDGFANGTMQEWDDYSYDMSQFAGKEVRIFWILEGSGTTTAPGFWFDDLTISGQTGTPPAIEITSPSNGGSVSGKVAIEVTVSDDTEWIGIEPVPPVLGNLIYSPIPDNDSGNDTKTYTVYWDSRWTYNGGALLTLRAYDDEDEDDIRDDLVAADSVSVNVTNTHRNPDWHEGFENITTLGGYSGDDFDGDWFISSSGTSIWRITGEDSHLGGKCAKMGPSASGGNYGANEFDQLYSPVHDCSGATRPHLRIWHRVDVENSGRGDIAKILLVRYDGTDDMETPIAEYRDDTAPAGQWKEQWFNLTDFKSAPFRLNFLFDSDSDSNFGTGWFVDDYEILDADPQIDSITDPSGAPGKAVVINGSNFGKIQGTSTVTFAKEGGGRTQAAVSSWGEDAIAVTVPADAASGDVIVTVLGFESAGEYFGVSLAPPNLTGIGKI
jgi:hypothetical protein